MEDYIDECISSILSSTYKDYEIIIVNDASTDSSLEKVKQYDYDNITIVDCKENGGAGIARGVGLSYAKGDYIWFIDADDWINSDSLEKLVTKADETNADVIDGVAVVMNKMRQKSEVYEPDSPLGKYQLIERKIPFLNNKLIKRKKWEKVGYSPSRYIEDIPSLYKVLYYCDTVAGIDDEVYYYRDNTSSLTHTADKHKSILYKLRATFECALFEKTHPLEIKRWDERFISFKLLLLTRYMKENEKEIEKYKSVIKEIIKMGKEILS